MDEQAYQLLKEWIGRVEQDVKEVKSDVKDILAFKWQIIGFSLAGSAFLTVLLQTIFFYIEQRGH